VLEGADNELTPIARELIAEWAEELRQLEDKIHTAQERQKALVRDNPAAGALQEVPGFGPVNSALVFSAVGDARQFTNGRQMAAWMGLVPRHTGTRNGFAQGLLASRQAAPSLPPALAGEPEC
jgi:transposase